MRVLFDACACFSKDGKEELSEVRRWVEKVNAIACRRRFSLGRVFTPMPAVTQVEEMLHGKALWGEAMRAALSQFRERFQLDEGHEHFIGEVVFLGGVAGVAKCARVQFGRHAAIFAAAHKFSATRMPLVRPSSWKPFCQYAPQNHVPFCPLMSPHRCWASIPASVN